jgi:cysteine synthase
MPIDTVSAKNWYCDQSLALGIIEVAEQSGQLKPGQTVIEATSGNTGIGLAMVCAQKGYPLVVTMAEQFSVERRRPMRFLGAKVVLTPAAGRAVAMSEPSQGFEPASETMHSPAGSHTTYRLSLYPPIPSRR